jgi:protein-S-isoprenylcysteine O-methyltransferase Ste14
VVVVTIFQLLRISAEERWLTQTTGYAEYRQRTRWRLLPGIY